MVFINYYKDTDLPPPWVHIKTLPIAASSKICPASLHLGHTPAAFLAQSRQKAWRQCFCDANTILAIIGLDVVRVITMCKHILPQIVLWLWDYIQAFIQKVSQGVGGARRASKRTRGQGPFVTEFEIGGTSRIFVHKFVHLRNHSSYKLEMWHEYIPTTMFDVTIMG